MIKKFGSIFALALFAAALALDASAQTSLQLGGNLIGSCGTVTATGNGTAGAATLNNKCGVVTSEALTAPTASEYSLTLTNSAIAAADVVLFSVANGTNTTGLGGAGRVTPAAGSAVFVVQLGSGASFNGTVTVRYLVIKP